MDSNWAEENLRVIRTLMERSAIYRRALAPVMTLNGVLGLAGAFSGLALRIDSPRGFILLWFGVAALALLGSFLLVRAQALKEAEDVWSPPARRVIQALLPALFVGFAAGGIVMLHVNGAPEDVGHVLAMLWLPLGWVVLYGCALHAAGFFMLRGIRLLGWAFIIGGCLMFAMGTPDFLQRGQLAYGIMGLFFGALHLAYGIYLYFTEPRKNEA